jgi:hypothetical protein
LIIEAPFSYHVITIRRSFFHDFPPGSFFFFPASGIEQEKGSSGVVAWRIVEEFVGLPFPFNKTSFALSQASSKTQRCPRSHQNFSCRRRI